MITDRIKYGETYGIRVTAQDADGAVVAIDETWQARIRIVAGKLDGEPIFTESLTIADNAASVSFDTGDTPWDVGTYYYDIRFTDPAGNDTWTDTIQLILQHRITPAS